MTKTPTVSTPAFAKGSGAGLALAALIAAAYVAIRLTAQSTPPIPIMLASTLGILAGLYTLGLAFLDFRWLGGAAAMIFGSALFLDFDPAHTVAFQFFSGAAFLAYATLVRAMVDKTASNAIVAAAASAVLGVLSWRAAQFMAPLWVPALLGFAFEFLKNRDLKPQVRKIFKLQIAAMALLVIAWVLLALYGPNIIHKMALDDLPPHPATQLTGYAYFKATFPSHFGYAPLWIAPFISVLIPSRIYENALTKKRTNVSWLFWFMIWCCAWWITFSCTYVGVFRPQLLWATVPVVASALLVVIAAPRPRYSDLATVVAILLFAFNAAVATTGWPVKKSPLPYWLFTTPVTQQ